MNEVVAITTKYLGPTDHRGSRVRASIASGESITIPYSYYLSGEDVHKEAALALCKKIGWAGKMVGGTIRGGYVFVFVEE